jgi:hypothetical protein
MRAALPYDYLEIPNVEISNVSRVPARLKGGCLPGSNDEAPTMGLVFFCGMIYNLTLTPKYLQTPTEAERSKAPWFFFMI